MKSKLLFLSSAMALTIALSACNEKSESTGIGGFFEGIYQPNSNPTATTANPITTEATEVTLPPDPVNTPFSSIPGEVQGKRYALVIGNADYSTGLGKLKNSVNDAKGMAETLRKVGFEVQLVTNAENKRKMKNAVDKFVPQLMGGGVGLFYYAGHGVAVNGENYLIPVKADLKYQEDAEDESLQVKYVLDTMDSSKSNMNIVILDACRNNPLPMKSRSTGKGLADIKQKMMGSSIIMFATSPGETAADGSGKHGAYTQHLMEVVKKPSLTIEQMAKEVRRGVMNDTNGSQRPWENASLMGEFCFVSCPGAMPIAGPSPSPASSVFKPVQPAPIKPRVVTTPTVEKPPVTEVPLPAVIRPVVTKPSVPTSLPPRPVGVPTSSNTSGPPPTTLQQPTKCLLEPWRCNQ